MLPILKEFSEPDSFLLSILITGGLMMDS